MQYRNLKTDCGCLRPNGTQTSSTLRVPRTDCYLDLERTTKRRSTRDTPQLLELATSSNLEGELDDPTNIAYRFRNSSANNPNPFADATELIQNPAHKNSPKRVTISVQFQEIFGPTRLFHEQQKKPEESDSTPTMLGLSST